MYSCIGGTLDMRKIKNATFRQLQVFEAIARTGSFTAAAKELHLTQPTISVQVKKLTDIVGMPLFEVMGKKVHLTGVGKQLLKTSHAIFKELNDFEMTLSDIKGVKEGTLKLSGVTTVEYFAPRILGGFSRKYPGIRVSLEVTNRSRVINRLQENLDDIYICGPVKEEIGIEDTLFLQNPLVILAAPDHPLVGKKNIPIEALQDEQFLMREPGCGTYLALDKIVGERKIQFKHHMELGSNEAIKQAVMSGLGISLLSIYALTHELESGELAILDVVGFPYIDEWHVIYPKGKKLSIVAQAFYDYLLSEGRELVQEHLAKVPG